jgi:peptidoglycan/xylan/chitin deacetylase (PgdA/CDA1 family)
VTVATRVRIRKLQSLIGAAVSLGLISAAGAGQPNEIVRGPRGKGHIALTFDAGGDANCFFDLIKTLSDAGVKSTFFITGKWAQENPECAREITRQGHEIGNHTWSHIDLTQQPDAGIRDELIRAQTLLTRVCRQDPRPLWRAPYGARDARVLRIANSIGYRSIYWTIDSLDSVGAVKSVSFLYDRIANRNNEQLDGAIILMHVGHRSTAEAVPLIARSLQQRGFQLVPVSTLIRGAR